VISLEGDNLVVFYYYSESEIWPDKRGVAFGRSDIIRRGTTVLYNIHKCPLKRGVLYVSFLF